MSLSFSLDYGLLCFRSPPSSFSNILISSLLSSWLGNRISPANDREKCVSLDVDKKEKGGSAREESRFEQSCSYICLVGDDADDERHDDGVREAEAGCPVGPAEILVSVRGHVCWLG